MDLITLQKKLSFASEEYNDIFYTESMIDNGYSCSHEIPEITKSMLRIRLRDILEYFFSNDNNIDFKDIINIKNTYNFILKSKERFTLDNYKKPSPDEFYNYEKFCL